MNYKNNFFSESTTSHLRLQMGMSERHLQRSFEVTLACKLALTYGKYHLMMLHRQLAMSEKRTSFHHAQMDGSHAARFLEELQKTINTLK